VSDNDVTCFTGIAEVGKRKVAKMSIQTTATNTLNRDGVNEYDVDE